MGMIIETTTTANPAAGAEVSYTNPGLIIYSCLYAIRIRLVTDATVANRRVTLIVSDVDGTTPLYVGISPIDQTASQTIDYFFGPYGVAMAAAVNSRIAIPVPPIHWCRNMVLSTSTSGIVAGDDFAAATLLHVWNGPGGYPF